jgi:hypothetical protein
VVPAPSPSSSPSKYTQSSASIFKTQAAAGIQVPLAEYLFFYYLNVYSFENYLSYTKKDISQALIRRTCPVFVCGVPPSLIGIRSLSNAAQSHQIISGWGIVPEEVVLPRSPVWQPECTLWS